MNATRRRLAPAIIMGVAIVLAIALAALAPFHMIGPWNDGSSPPATSEQSSH